MKTDLITNALELFNAAKIHSRHTPDKIRNKSLNHTGHDFNNKPQFIGMEADGRVWAYGINPACLVSGAVTEDHQIALTAESGMWGSMYSTPHEHIGKLNPIDYNWMEMLFPIDDSFTEVERVECACCDGYGYITDETKDVWHTDDECPDCLGSGSVPNGKV